MEPDPFTEPVNFETLGLAQPAEVSSNAAASMRQTATVVVFETGLVFIARIYHAGGSGTVRESLRKGKCLNPHFSYQTRRDVSLYCLIMQCNGD